MKNEIKANKKVVDKVMAGTHAGNSFLNPLKHKNGKPLSDVEYFILLGAKAEEYDALNPYPNIPTKYPDGYDPATMQFAKQVKKMKEEGISDIELKQLIAATISIDD